MDTNQINEADRIIDALGGTSAVASLCDLTTGAVSQWRTSETGIPKPWLKFFKSMRPDLFEPDSTLGEAAEAVAMINDKETA